MSYEYVEPPSHSGLFGICRCGRMSFSQGQQFMMTPGTDRERFQGLLDTTLGRWTAIVLAVTAGYVFWLFAINTDPRIEQWVSAFCLNLPYALFIVFGLQMVRRYPMQPRLKRSWLLLIVATACILIAEFFYILQGRPPLSEAEPFYFAYYVLYTLGILLFPFVPISRRERSLLLLDLGIVMLASTLLLWHFLINSILDLIATHNYAVLSNIVYPVLDMLIVACAVTIIQRDVEGLHPAALLCIAVANGMASVGDVFLIFYTIGSPTLELKLSCAVFMVLRFLVLLALAFQIASLEHPQNRTSFLRTKRLLRDALPYVASLFILGLLVVVLGSQKTMELKLRGALFGTLLLIAIVLYRQYIMLRENVFLYQQARQAGDEAEKATRAKAEFLANMSHEIRTPLHGVIGMSELLVGGELNQQQRTIAETLRSSGNALLSVINDILDFSKIESGTVELQSRPFDLRQCVGQALDPFKIEADNKSIRLNCLIAPSVPPVIVGDEARVRGIMMNLLSNAVKFTDRGEISLLAESVAQGDQKHEIHISVRDTGIGIPVKFQEKLFQSFSQIDASPTRRYGGTGLGLAISKRLTEMMGGRMWLESIEGAGSTFHFTLTTREASAASIASGQFYVDSGLARRLPLKILVVDDNPVHRKVALLMLKELGYNPDLAGNGVEALRAHRERSYDLILMDMQMPMMDGLECTRQIRQGQAEGQRVIIVALTASAVKGDRERCLDAGMNDILTKPVPMNELQGMILRWWDLPKALSFPPPDSFQPAAAEIPGIPLLTQIPPESRRQVLEELVKVYLSDSPVRVRAIREAASGRDLMALRREAHALKGASTLMGLVVLANACNELEQVNNEDELTRSESLIRLLEEEFETASKHLAELLSRQI